MAASHKLVLIALCCLLAIEHVSAQDSGSLSEQQVLDRCTQNSVTPVSCAEVNSMDGLVPHPDDCELFYYCVQPDLAPICRQCPANLHFNPVLHVCDWPSQAGCNVSNSGLEYCSQRSVTPVSCAEAVTLDGLLPHPDACDLFYYCVQPYLPPVCRHCPANLHFNPVLYVCDWPYRAGCTLDSSSNETLTTTEWMSNNETTTEVALEIETDQQSDDTTVYADTPLEYDVPSF